MYIPDWEKRDWETQLARDESEEYRYPAMATLTQILKEQEKLRDDPASCSSKSASISPNLIPSRAPSIVQYIRQPDHAQVHHVPLW